MSAIRSIPGPAETGGKAIGLASTATNQLDTITTTYLEPLAIFNTIVNGIANVSLPTWRWFLLMQRMHLGPSIRPIGVKCVGYGLQGMRPFFSMAPIDANLYS